MLLVARIIVVIRFGIRYVKEVVCPGENISMDFLDQITRS